MSKPVNYVVDKGVADIELNRPHAANAINLELAQALRGLVEQAAADDAVRAVLVTGSGKRFCAGGDLRSIADAADPAAFIHTLAIEADAATRALAGLSKPVVAGVTGAVVGAGLAVMLSCDLIVADPDTRFSFAYPDIGLTPDCGVSWLLPRAMGQQRSLQFALEGRAMSAEEALASGLITEIADDSTVRARELAESLAARPAFALGQTRRLMRDCWDSDRAAAGTSEARVLSEMVETDEAQSLLTRVLAR